MARRGFEQHFSFTAGQIDHEAAGREDVAPFYASARVLRNITLDPRGMARAANGTEIIATIPGALRTTRFRFSAAQQYLLVWLNLSLKIYRDDALVATLASPWAAADVPSLIWTQSRDTMFVTHASYPTYTLQRKGSDIAWSLTVTAFVNVPKVLFARTYPAYTVTPGAVTGSGVTLTASADFWRAADVGAIVNGNSGQARVVGYTSPTVVTVDVTSDWPNTNPMVPGAWLFRMDGYLGPPVNLTPSATAGETVTVTLSAPYFVDDDVDAFIRGNQGEAIITQVVSTTVARVAVQEPFQNINTITAGNWEFRRLTEPVWSARRGYPAACALHEGRLYLAGHRDRPNRIDGSTIADPYDFKVGLDLLDTDAVAAELGGNEVSNIHSLFSGDGLFLLTDNGVFVQRTGAGITPNTFIPRKDIDQPAAAVQPVALERAMAFVQASDGGTAVGINEVVYNDALSGYDQQDLSILARSLITGPFRIAVRRGDAAANATHLFVLNGDGTMAVLNSKRSQQVAGWTQWTIDGTILDVAVVGEALYLLTERDIAGQPTIFLEKEVEGLNLSGAIRQTAGAPTANWAGLSLLDGETVQLVGDGRFLGNATIVAGAVTLPEEVSALDIGFPRTWEILLMPVAQGGYRPLAGRRHRIVNATIRFWNTAGCAVNGQDLNFPRTDVDQFDSPITPWSGEWRVRTLGWSGGRRAERARLRLSGSMPLPATIAAVTLEIAT